MRWSYLSTLLFICLGYYAEAKLPCEYLSMVDGNVKVQKGTTICLGNCENVNKANAGIYIARDQEIFFTNFILSTDPHIDKFTIRHKDGTVILTCRSETNQCFTGAEPTTLPDRNIAGLFLTGLAGGDALTSVFDPWTVLSTLRLDSYSSLMNVQLLDGAHKITGWRITTKSPNQETFMYTFTDRGQLFVGTEIDAAKIVSAAPNTVYAEGPVVVRKGTLACPIPIPRPNVPSAQLIYSAEISSDGSCDFTNQLQSFVMQVELNWCYPSPEGIQTSIFPTSYYKVTTGGITFHNDLNCVDTGTITQFVAICNRGWSAILLPVQV